MRIKFLACLAAFWALTVANAEDLPKIEVFKSPTCGCCTKWAKHLEDAGFDVTTRDETDMNSIKKELNVPASKASCHTAVVDGYVIEGHVPAKDIIELLKQRPQVRGLTVPGMPLGSPGMEAPRSQPYVVYTFDDDGNTEPFAEHNTEQ